MTVELLSARSKDRILGIRLIFRTKYVLSCRIGDYRFYRVTDDEQNDADDPFRIRLLSRSIEQVLHPSFHSCWIGLTCRLPSLLTGIDNILLHKCLSMSRKKKRIDQILPFFSE